MKRHVHFDENETSKEFENLEISENTQVKDKKSKDSKETIAKERAERKKKKNERKAHAKEHQKKKEETKEKPAKPKNVKKTREISQPLEFFPTYSYMSLSGVLIDDMGAQESAFISQVMRKTREKRDGNHYHITVINHLDIKKLVSRLTDPKQKDEYNGMLGRVASTIDQSLPPVSEWPAPIDLGLGRCRTSDNLGASYFRVVLWPFGQEIRKLFKLTFANFHITCGYFPIDIHEYKGPGALICLEDDQPCSLKQATLLVSMAGYYAHDFEFLKKLVKTCKRHGYKQLNDELETAASAHLYEAKETMQ